jgi:hypothetical protein
MILTNNLGRLSFLKSESLNRATKTASKVASPPIHCATLPQLIDHVVAGFPNLIQSSKYPLSRSTNKPGQSCIFEQDSLRCSQIS